MTRQTLGIDLETRHNEVRKLLFAGFGRRIYRAGYDPEDVLQEVFRGILARNRGKCPWDPEKSTFGHYVHMVCECVLNNYHRKKKRIRERERIGLRAEHSEESLYADQDVALVAANAPDEVSEAPSHTVLLDSHRRDLVQHLKRSGRSKNGLRQEAKLAIQILPLMEQGMKRSEISQHLSVSSGRVGKSMAFLRREADTWMRG